jgi:type I restriction enzyme R subunit
MKPPIFNSCLQLLPDNSNLNPFNAQGGLSKMWQLFGNETEDIINELNRALAA